MAFFMGTALVLGLLALGFVLFPLLRDAAIEARQQSRREVNAAIHRDRIHELERDLENGTLNREQFDQATRDLERDLVQSGAIDPDDIASKGGRGHRAGVVAAAMASCVAVPAFALLFYGQVGQYDLAVSQAGAAHTQQSAPGGGAPQRQHETGDEMVELVRQLRQRLEANPENPEAWALYARTMRFMEQREVADEAYEQAIALDNENADLLSEYADFLGASNGTLEGRPSELIEQSLALDPQNVRGLWLAGTAAFNRSDYEEAETFWERLLEVVPSSSEAATEIRNNIASLPHNQGGGQEGASE